MSLSLEQRVARLEDRVAISDLAVLYGFVMDERDIDSLPRLFAKDAALHSADGVFAAAGLDDIIATYRARFDVLEATNHVSHGHVIRFDDSDPDRAWGVVSSHAEVVRNSAPMIVALRYRDDYVRTVDGWRFQCRTMSYMYYLDVREYADALGTRLRNRAYGDHRPADWPEVLQLDADLSWLRAALS